MQDESGLWRDTGALEVDSTMSAGLGELEPLLTRQGFELTKRDSGKGSGGYFATADYARDDRRLHLWLRFNSLSVRYRIGRHELDHSGYMRELLGPGGANRFPTYSNDAGAAFGAASR